VALGGTQVEVYFDDFNVEHTKSPVIQTDDYYPFGLAFNSYSRENSVPQNYKFNGKEEQTELDLNWYDYGARMYDATIGRWFVVDPLSEVNRRWSPYRYAYNNPLRFIDPDGMFEVIINGSKADDATRQLDASSNLNITRDSKTGKLSASGEAKTKADRKLLAAINSKEVKVDITADGAKTTTDPSTGGALLMVGGAFMGNTVGTETTTRTEIIPGENGMCGPDDSMTEVDITTTSTVVTAEQHVNPDILGAMDAANGNNGAGMLHETLEAYEGGLISLKNGVSSPAAGQPGSVYNKAHSRAPSQGATITGTYWDAAGNLLPSEVGATRVEMKSNGRVIMTYPK
jgi:RHS repeat-associated protein